MSLIDVFKYPVWAASVATGAKDFRRNKVLGSPRLNRYGLHRGRVRLAGRLAAARRSRLRHLVSEEDAAAFARDGFALKRNFLPADDFQRLRDAVFEFRGSAREMVQGDTITRRMALDPSALERLPEVAALLNMPQWRGLMHFVASTGQEPLYYIQTILSHVRPGPPDPRTELHADTFHSTLKAWYFLTDVGEDEGPFVYVPGSHRVTEARLNWEAAMSEVASDAGGYTARGSFRIGRDELERLGFEKPQAFVVPANTLVVADTFGFHARAPSAAASRRLEIWAYNRRNPFVPWTGLDVLSTPGVAERRVSALWALRDIAEWTIGKNNPWRPVGIRHPYDGP